MPRLSPATPPPTHHPRTHLLIQRVQHALSRAIAVALVRQQHQTRAAPVALEGRVEALRLQREGARVVVLLLAVVVSRVCGCGCVSERVLSGGEREATDEAACSTSQPTATRVPLLPPSHTSPWMRRIGFLMRSAILSVAVVNKCVKTSTGGKPPGAPNHPQAVSRVPPLPPNPPHNTRQHTTTHTQPTHMKGDILAYVSGACHSVRSSL